jgi:hypothetical protein
MIVKKINESTYSFKIIDNKFIDNKFIDKNNEIANNKIMYKSILNIIPSAQLDSFTNSLFISCEKIISLKKYLFSLSNKRLTYETCIKLIDDISKQLTYLYKYDYGCYGFDVNDILKIDNYFIIGSSKYLCPITDDMFYFYYPIEMPYFSSPELIQLTVLPFEIDYKCSFYSLGVLVVYSLLNVYLLVGNEIMTTNDINKVLLPLKNTKIYWFIIRCLDENVNKRTLLLI